MRPHPDACRRLYIAWVGVPGLTRSVVLGSITARCRDEARRVAAARWPPTADRGAPRVTAAGALSRGVLLEALARDGARLLADAARVDSRRPPV